VCWRRREKELRRRSEALCHFVSHRSGSPAPRQQCSKQSSLVHFTASSGDKRPDDNALQSEDWTEFEKLFGEVQGESEQGKTTDSHTVYNEAVARAHDLVVDLRQMERKELSARNDKIRILNLIEQHAKSCKGPKIFGSHTQYPDFLPQKDATLRGGR
jgi:hypothetical protein